MTSAEPNPEASRPRNRAQDVPRRRRWRSLEQKPRFLREARWAGQGATHASHGYPWMDTPGLRGAGTAQRNARIQRFNYRIKLIPRGPGGGGRRGRGSGAVIA